MAVGGSDAVKGYVRLVPLEGVAAFAVDAAHLRDIEQVVQEAVAEGTTPEEFIRKAADEGGTRLDWNLGFPGGRH